MDQANNKNKPARVYCDGIYDCFHYGHAKSLQQAKKLFPNTYLIVGVCNDEITHKVKGKTIMNEKERAESVRHCRYVDEVIENAPWVVTQEFMDDYSIDYIAHGEDLSLDENGKDAYEFVKKQGKFKVIKRTDGISTSDLITRIIRDHDEYVKRNLFRGMTPEEMNLHPKTAKRLLDEVKKEHPDLVLKGEDTTPKSLLDKVSDKWQSFVSSLVSGKQESDCDEEVANDGQEEQEDEVSEEEDDGDQSNKKRKLNQK